MGFELAKAVADKGNAELKKREGDYVDENGLLVCGKCGERRQKVIELDNPEPGNPNRKTRLVVSVICRCDREAEELRQKRQKDADDMAAVRRLRGLSLMDQKTSEATFEKFEKTKYNDRIFNICKRYADKFDLMVERNQGLILWGDVGTGKSFVASCIANSLLERKIPVMMTSFVKILELAQSQETDAIENMNKAKLLVLDDLGAERSTDYALEKVYNIVDSRYRRGLPMVLTTNLSLTDMKQESDIRYSRIYDRIFETCYPVRFTGPSWRKKEASKRYDEMKALLEGDEDG